MEFEAVLEILIWPAVVFGMFYLVRKEVRAVLAGVTKVKWKDAEVTTRSQEIVWVEDSTNQIKSSTDKSSLEESKNPVLRREKLIVREQLSQVPENQKEDRLIAQMAIERLNLKYERIYRTIYTSQINALSYLRERPDYSAPTATVETYWSNASSNNPGYTFDAWSTYLIDLNLVEKQSGEIIKITDNGQLLLDWIRLGSHSRAPNKF